jgi:adenosylcobinamide kinase/adenosylcobinamide-phosphate guanylyltransferase
MAYITLITGGQRSGKSSYAKQLALQLSPSPVYLATSRIWDKEHEKRIKRHQADRGPEWINIEEEKEIATAIMDDQVVIVDCITLWLTNFFFDNKSDVEQSLKEAKEEIEKVLTKDAQIIMVTNEIGLGGMPVNELQRQFTDLQGWVNQYIASIANQVILMVSGLPLHLK